MLSALVDKKYTLHWLLFHIALGFVSTLTVVPLVVWYYAVFAVGLYKISKTHVAEKYKVILFMLAYMSTLELLSRMSKVKAIIPYENSKYLFFILLTIGILSELRKHAIGWIMMVMLLPSLFIDISGMVTGYQSYVFNILGPANIAMGIIYLHNKKITENNFIDLLRIISFALVTSLIFTYIKTPNYEEIEFKLTANFSTTGGFGSNQVSSAFGFGAVLMFFAWVQNWKLFKYRLIDVLFLLLFIFQGIITFSRGGIIGGVLALILFLVLKLVYSTVGEKKNVQKILKYTFISIAIAFLGFSYMNRMTGGMLLLRYQGHTAGTAAGTKEQTINNITSNRLDIFLGDIELWEKNIIFGVGAGASRYLRTKVNGIISHVEFSRLLAEHGILGLIFFILLLKFGFDLFLKLQIQRHYLHYVQMAFFFLAIYTTFHASLRTFLTPLLIVLSVLSISTQTQKN